MQLEIYWSVDGWWHIQYTTWANLTMISIEFSNPSGSGVLVLNWILNLGHKNNEKSLLSNEMLLITGDNRVSCESRIQILIFLQTFIRNQYTTLPQLKKFKWKSSMVCSDRYPASKILFEHSKKVTKGKINNKTMKQMWFFILFFNLWRTSLFSFLLGEEPMSFKFDFLNRHRLNQGILMIFFGWLLWISLSNELCSLFQPTHRRNLKPIDSLT